jgi:Glycosyl hydrolases family 16
MVRVRLVRFTVVAATALALAAALAAQPAETSVSPDVQTVSATTTPPTNAGKVFKWGNKQWGDEFVTPLSSMWEVNRPGTVVNQHGMLTLDTTAGAVTATVQNHWRKYGRWEARVRARQYGSGGTPYRVLWELVPGGVYHCAARNIVLSDYKIGTNTAAMALRNLPNANYTDTKALPLSDNQFHTYAVEVTPDHISWFVDTRVIMTERRAPARTGALYSVRFRLVAPAGAKMNRGRMQMDWVRYYTLDRPNAKSIEAPQATLGTYADAC